MSRTRSLLPAVMIALLLGAAGRSDADPDVARALQLSPHGGGGYAHASSDAYRIHGDLTLEAWVKADPSQPLSPYPVVVAKPCGNVLNGDATFAFVLQRSNGAAYFRVTTTVGQYNATWAGNALDGKWHHLAGVRTTTPTSQLLFYVDGTLVSTVGCAGNDSTSTYDLDVGGLVAGLYTGNRLVGEIDEVRVWNVARTASQIATSRFHVFNWAPGLVSDWHCDVLHTGPDSNGNPVPYLENSDGEQTELLELEGDVALDPSDAPITRGVAMEPLEVFGRGGYPFPTSWICMAPGPDSTWLTTENHGVPGMLMGIGVDGWAQLDALGETSGYFGLEGGASLNCSADALMNNGTHGWLGWSLHGVSLLGVPLPSGTMDLDLSDVATPDAVVDSMPPFHTIKLIADPVHGTQAYRIAAGGLFGPPGQDLILASIGTPGAYQAVATIDLGSLPVPVSDVTATGDLVFVAFPDSVREYKRIYVGINQQQFLQRRPVSFAVNDGSPFGNPRGAAVASDNHYLYLAGTGGNTFFRVYDITNPDAPTFVRGIGIEDDVPEAIAVSKGYAYVAGINGIQAIDVSEPQRLTWVGNWCTDLPPLGSPPLWADGRKVVVADGDAGVYLLSNDAVTVTAVADSPAPPVTAELIGWPNPSRGAVSLRYTLPREGDATLEVFDVAGRLLRQVHGRAGVGEHVWTWDGRDQEGHVVGAGVYLARLETADGRRTLRLVELGRL